MRWRSSVLRRCRASLIRIAWGGADTPHYSWQWDSAKIKLTGKQVKEALAATRPVSIGYILPPNYAGSEGMRGRPDPSAGSTGAAAWVARRDDGDPNRFGMNVWLLKEGEDRIIADRLVEIFSAAVGKASQSLRLYGMVFLRPQSEFGRWTGGWLYIAGQI